MSNDSDFDAYDWRQRDMANMGPGELEAAFHKAGLDPIVRDYAEALGMEPRLDGNVRMTVKAGPEPLCENAQIAAAAQNYQFSTSWPLGSLLPDGPQPPQPTTPSEPLLVGLTLRRIPDGGVLVTALDGEVVFCASVIEEALEYCEDRLGGVT